MSDCYTAHYGSPRELANHLRKVHSVDVKAQPGRHETKVGLRFSGYRGQQDHLRQIHLRAVKAERIVAQKGSR